MNKQLILLIILPFLLVVTSVDAKHKKQHKVNVESATAILIFDRTTNKIVEELNINEPRAIASMSKLMTVYVVLESNADLNEKIVIKAQKIHGSRVLRSGMIITRRELINLTLIASDNLASMSLADNYASGYNAFIEKMNSTALSIGMLHTTFIEPSGLMLNIGSAWDMHLLLTAASKYSIYNDAAMVKTVDSMIPNKKGKLQRFVIRNTNIFAGNFEIQVAKTGYTKPAGWCIGMMIKHNGQEFDIIILGSPDKKTRYELVANKLQNYMNHNRMQTVVMQMDALE